MKMTNTLFGIESLKGKEGVNFFVSISQGT